MICLEKREVYTQIKRSLKTKDVLSNKLNKCLRLLTLMEFVRAFNT